TVLVRNPARLVDKDPQHATLAAAQKLQIHQLQPARRNYAIRNFPYAIELKCHLISHLRSTGADRNRRKLKSGLSPTGVLRQVLELHNSFHLFNIRSGASKHKPARAILPGKYAPEGRLLPGICEQVQPATRCWETVILESHSLTTR